MSLGVSSYATNFLLLSYLPTIVQYFLHTIHPYIYHQGQIPQPGSSRYYRNYILCFVVITIGYMGYNLYQVDADLATNHYSLLGMTRETFSEKRLKKVYNQLSRDYHPDKNPNYQEYYLKLKHSYEVLKNTIKRRIYDCLGDSGLVCRECSVLKDYLWHHVHDMIIFYLSSCFFIGFYVLIGFQSNLFWKFLVLATLAYIEIAVMLGAIDFSTLSLILPGRTPYEFTLYFRQIAFDVIYLTGHFTNLAFPNADQRLQQGFAVSSQLVRAVHTRAARLFSDQIVSHPERSKEQLFQRMAKLQEAELMISSKRFEQEFTKSINTPTQ